MKTRQDFEALACAKKAPFILPTLFQNHMERDNYVTALNQRRRKDNDFLSPKRKIDAHDLYRSVFEDLCVVFKDMLFLKHTKTAELVWLKEEFDMNEAFEEILMLRPFCYSRSNAVKEKSKYIDLKAGKNAKLLPMTDKCLKPGKVVVDFSIIYPEGKVSTAYVSCTDCGQVAETAFRKETLLKLQKEIMKLLMFFKINSDDPEPFRATIPLPMQCLLDLNGSTFIDGIMGITPIVRGTVCSPSVFVRTQITYIVSSMCKIPTLIHNFHEVDGLYPNHAEKY